MTDKLPDNGGYVAAAYLVFLILLLIYFAIMAVRAGRIERELGEVLDMVQQAERPPDAAPQAAGAGADRETAATTGADG